MELEQDQTEKEIQNRQESVICESMRVTFASMEMIMDKHGMDRQTQFNQLVELRDAFIDNMNDSGKRAVSNAFIVFINASMEG